MKARRQRIIAMTLVAMILLLVPLRAYAEFKYLDKVIVVKGFYRGGCGAVQQNTGSKYRVKLLPSGTVITVMEDEIQHTSRGSW